MRANQFPSCLNYNKIRIVGWGCSLVMKYTCRNLKAQVQSPVQHMYTKRIICFATWFTLVLDLYFVNCFYIQIFVHRSVYMHAMHKYACVYKLQCRKVVVQLTILILCLIPEVRFFVFFVVIVLFLVEHLVNTFFLHWLKSSCAAKVKYLLGQKCINRQNASVCIFSECW